MQTSRRSKKGLHLEETESSTTVTVNMLGVLTLEILKDKAFDEIGASNDFTISEYEETFNQAFIVDPDQSYDPWACWGYFACAELNGYRIPSTSGTKLLSMTKVPTIIILDRPPSSTSVGSTVTFTGRLSNTDTGKGIAGATIEIYDRDPDFDDLLASGTTRSDGTFSIQWTAKKGDWYDNTTEVYAKFKETTAHSSSQSQRHVITIS
ncbi:MAG: transthyretin-like family protein [Candidatus Bathyarchaeota archaeon]|nr:transthyretin-like family protein [Candidatus Bathyarchaeota archaeon]